MTRLFIILIYVLTSVSCSYLPKMDKILPDKRNEYKRSESLPDLEVPPDLTADAINDSMSIPNEGSRRARDQEIRNNATAMHSGVTPTDTQAGPDEQWVSVRDDTGNIWPRLSSHMLEQGYGLDLNDAELGVLETTWTEPRIENGFSYRDKFKIFSEPGAEAGITVLFVTNQRQVLARRQDGSDNWIDKEKSKIAEQKLAGDLNLFFNGGSRETVATSPSSGPVPAQRETMSRQKALVESMEDGNEYLAIPEEFTRAWRHTEIALQRAGLPVDRKDQGKGIYYVTYFDPGREEKQGWLSKLKFWRSDEAPEGVPYQVSLTGVGDKTELVILDQNGEWATNNDALQILAIIQNHLNNL